MFKILKSTVKIILTLKYLKCFILSHNGNLAKSVLQKYRNVSLSETVLITLKERLQK